MPCHVLLTRSAFGNTIASSGSTVAKGGSPVVIWPLATLSASPPSHPSGLSAVVQRAAYGLGVLGSSLYGLFWALPSGVSHLNDPRCPCVVIAIHWSISTWLPLFLEGCCFFKQGNCSTMRPTTLLVTGHHQAPLEGTRDVEGAWPWENRGTLLAEGLTYSNKKLPMS
jgi:hypothetical protein